MSANGPSDTLRLPWLPTAEISVPEAACRYADHGYNPILLHGINPATGHCTCDKGKECGKSSGKHPRAARWQQTRRDPLRTRKEFNLADFHDQHPNVGLAMGGASRLIALDLDGPEALRELAELEAKLGPLPATLESISGRQDGGSHRIYRVPDHLDQARLGNRKPAPHIDLRVKGGQIVVAPSLHYSGRRYRWANDLAPAPLPEAWYHHLATTVQAPRIGAVHAGRRPDAAILAAAIETLSHAPDGSRNETLFSVAYTLALKHLDPWRLEETALEIGLGAVETQRTIQSAIHRAQDKQTAGVRRTTEILEEPTIPPIPRDEAQKQIAEAIDTWHQGELLVIQSPCGSGKDHSLRKTVAKSSARRYLVGGPTYRLAWQGIIAAREMGVSAELREGRLRKKNPDDTWACKKHDDAELFQQSGGSVSRDFCPHCPHYKKDCTALGEDHGSIYIGTYDRLVPPLQDQITRHSPTETIVTPVFNECPPLFEPKTLSPEEMGWFDNLLETEEFFSHKSKRLLATAITHLLQPWTRVLLEALTREESFPEALQIAAKTFAENELTSPFVTRAKRYATQSYDQDTHTFIDDSLQQDFFDHKVAARGNDALAVIRTAAEACLRRVSSWLANPEALHERVDVVLAGRIDRIARLLCEAATAQHLRKTPDGSVTFVALTEQAKLLKNYGGIVLDATPSMDELRAIKPNLKHVNVNVSDGVEGTARILLYTSDSARRQLVPHGKPDWKRIEPLLREIFERANMRGIRRLVLCSFAEIITPLQEGTAPDSVMGILSSWRIGRQLEMTHYGGNRGLDRWADFDGYTSLGEHRPPVVFSRDLAEELFPGKTGEELDAESKRLGTDRARAESTQFHGRDRGPVRTLPAWHCHVGSLPPIGWDKSNCALVRLPQGRPKTAVENVAALCTILVAATGSQRKAAEVSGLNRDTLQRAICGSATAETANAIYAAVWRIGNSMVAEKLPKEIYADELPLGTLSATHERQPFQDTAQNNAPESSPTVQVGVADMEDTLPQELVVPPESTLPLEVSSEPAKPATSPEPVAPDARLAAMVAARQFADTVAWHLDAFGCPVTAVGGAFGDTPVHWHSPPEHPPDKAAPLPEAAHQPSTPNPPNTREGRYWSPDKSPPMPQPRPEPEPGSYYDRLHRKGQLVYVRALTRDPPKTALFLFRDKHGQQWWAQKVPVPVGSVPPPLAG